jgi:hypothetical protein
VSPDTLIVRFSFTETIRFPGRRAENDRVWAGERAALVEDVVNADAEIRR